MKNKSFALKAAVAGFMLLGASLSAHAGSGSASVGVQLNALPAGTCTVTPTVASFALPTSTAGTTASTYLTNFTTNAIFTSYGFKTDASMNQTVNLICGSTVTITSMTIAPVSIMSTGNFAYGALRDSAGITAFRSGGSNSTGLSVGTELLSINGLSTPFSFSALPSTAVPTYSTAFSVGTTPVPIVWRPTFYAGPWGTGALTAPTDMTGYRGDFIVTVNY